MAKKENAKQREARRRAKWKKKVEALKRQGRENAAAALEKRERGKAAALEKRKRNEAAALERRKRNKAAELERQNHAELHEKQKGVKLYLAIFFSLIGVILLVMAPTSDEPVGFVVGGLWGVVVGPLWYRFGRIDTRPPLAK